jgi:hypothetical protein
MPPSAVRVARLASNGSSPGCIGAPPHQEQRPRRLEPRRERSFRSNERHSSGRCRPAGPPCGEENSDACALRPSDHWPLLLRSTRSVKKGPNSEERASCPMIDCACADGAAMSIVESKKTQVRCRDTVSPSRRRSPRCYAVKGARCALVDRSGWTVLRVFLAGSCS